MVKGKACLAQHQAREATVRASTMEVARNLNRFRGHLRRTQGYQKYWVIANREGQPVLQVAEPGTGYSDYIMTTSEMEAFLANLGPNSPCGTGSRRASQRGKDSPGHRAKNRPQPQDKRPPL
jgi:hypothetical protein